MSGAVLASVTAEAVANVDLDGARRRQRPESGVRLRRARLEDKRSAGHLLREALTPELADAVFGLGVEGAATSYLERLFARAGTLWSYDLVTLAEVDGQVAGMVSHAPWTELARRYRATMWAYLRVYGPLRIFRLLPRLRLLIRASPPVPVDHWFIPYLAVFPKHRGNGVAKALLARVHRRADRKSSACSLYVLADNRAARQFYQQAGYVDGTWEESRQLYELAATRGRLRMDRYVSGGSRTPSNASLV
ncbi:MAG: GNAT family N-acetyltransferase [Chloroflexota bacterium]|nr:GNAT family N-acetyltransferase [Chloroflexota bacterium]MDE2919906.1 GNAT family N-acetyltransferase [Chloroflexota bacterium]